jgi:acyl dehydratase
LVIFVTNTNKILSIGGFMPVNTSVAGVSVGERRVTLTARMSMAYAAGADDLNARYFDDTRPDGIVAPPMAGVSLDWGLRDGLLAAIHLPPDESRRGVHATQDMTFHRLLRPGDELTVRGTIVQVEARSAGAYVVTRYDTADAAGMPVLTVYYGILFRGVATVGEPRTLDAPPPWPERVPGGAVLWSTEIVVPPHAPHVYSACADIYNPIHTERAVALAAGLPDIILHGTLTLAYAAREILNREAGGDPTRLRRLACRFGGIVIPGTTIDVRLESTAPVTAGRALFFTVVNAEGAIAIQNGMALLSAAV